MYCARSLKYHLKQRLGLTEVEIAKILNKSQSHVNMILNGKRPISNDDVVVLVIDKQLVTLIDILTDEAIENLGLELI